jgi:hypothetical protein
VDAVRVNARCGALIIRYQADVVGLAQLLALVDYRLARLGAEAVDVRGDGATPATLHALRVLLDFALAVLDPPGLGLGKDIVRTVAIVSAAVNELRTQPWHRVVLRAAWRVLCECSSFDILLPHGVRLALRILRRVVDVRRLVVRMRMRTTAPVSKPALAFAA